MTTIVYRDGVLASDRMSSGSSYIEPGFTRKIVAGPKHLGAACGDVSFVHEWLEFVASGSTDAESRPRPPLDGENDASACGWLIDAQGIVTVYTGHGHCVLDAPFAADGSGAPFALAALHTGATACEAVAIANKCDPWSGHGIAFLRIADIGDGNAERLHLVGT